MIIANLKDIVVHTLATDGKNETVGSIRREPSHTHNVPQTSVNMIIKEFYFMHNDQPLLPFGVVN